MTEIILIRHCATTGQEPEAQLSEAGAQQARQLASRLVACEPDAIYSSPYRRAVATIEPLAQRCGLPIRHDPRLRERVLAAGSQDWLEHQARSFGDAEYRLPGGESVNEALARGLAALRDIALAEHRLAVVISHGTLISLVLRTIDPSFGLADWRAMPNPAAYRVFCAAGVPVRFRSEPGASCAPPT